MKKIKLKLAYWLCLKNSNKYFDLYFLEKNDEVLENCYYNLGINYLILSIQIKNKLNEN